MIELSNVNKAFGQKVVLKHLNLTIPTGSIFGLIGPNGAGKSTLLYLLNGISQADSGSIYYDGQEVYENTEIKKDILLTFLHTLLLLRCVIFIKPGILHLMKMICINIPISSLCR